MTTNRTEITVHLEKFNSWEQTAVCGYNPIDADGNSKDLAAGAVEFVPLLDSEPAPNCPRCLEIGSDYCVIEFSDAGEE